MEEAPLAFAEALEWAKGGDGPTLVVIDSAESAGCPSDGADVAPWLSKLVLPFRDAGATVLVIDHVGKRRQSTRPYREPAQVSSRGRRSPVSDWCTLDSEDRRTPCLDQPQGQTRAIASTQR